MYDARQIANWFVRRAARDGRKLSIMQLLKLIYIAHGWHLEMRNMPLFGNKIEAWRRGPVVRDVYHSFRGQGVHISDEHPGFPIETDPAYDHFLNQIFDIYGGKSPFELSDMTHVEGGPWDVATKSYGLFAPIGDDLIKAHYMKLRSDHAQ